MSLELFSKKFNFGGLDQKKEYVNITNETFYTNENEYGFVTEGVKEKNELLQIPELGSAFDIDPSLIGQQISNILMEEQDNNNIINGFCYSDKPDVPLSFRVKIPRSGNYNIKLSMGNKNKDMTVSVFSQRRRCVLKNAIAKAGELIDFDFTANVCDIVPRGKTEVYKDDSIDITILGINSCINFLTVDEASNIPTIYIAGDSTVTDQGANYPYNPATSYCGWAQILPLFLKQGISVSNHSHSGLTTESFRSGGHWSIVERSIKQDDIIIMQFGHNDQKDKTLGAFGGYADNLRRYAQEIQEKGAYPVIVSPVSRTIWNGPNGSFNDMLKEYADACKQVAFERGIPLIDLHDKSVDFILKHGSKKVARYFYPKDYTHHNDFGAFEMARLVVDGIKEAKIHTIIKHLRDISEDEIQIKQVSNWVEPTDEAVREEFKLWSQSNDWAQNISFTKCIDIDKHFAKTDIEEVVKRGIMNVEDEKFNPNNILARANFLDIMLKVFRYSPTNVYNDVFDDVFGDEWYAGIIQAAYNYDIIPDSIIVNNTIMPEKPITIGEVEDIVLAALKLNKDIAVDLVQDKRNDKNSLITRGYVAMVVKKMLDKM
ncbi:rhamnogalacturonan acetylesterase [Clostridium lacusfryxellense]|uniref:rhamnogalacturonan acetylesterase n=1 Tax=Clostridium lacusfryxellense TaxID=205328 RepID=UPI001C0D8E2A|nr:rhamnogalacturonan acetylesterase [Clostridium lacusfryxellense]MBU3112775.1 S-layer homology domain-containing protein [Clostridium lacusfryxellense]